jgi:hypothetical protein
MKVANLYKLSWEFLHEEFDLCLNYPIEIVNLALNMINFRLHLSNKEDNNRRRRIFVMINFQGKNVEKLDLSSIFRKFSGLIPDSFRYKLPPTVIYKISKRIGSTIFN